MISKYFLLNFLCFSVGAIMAALIMADERTDEAMKARALGEIQILSKIGLDTPIGSNQKISNPDEVPAKRIWLDPQPEDNIFISIPIQFLDKLGTNAVSDDLKITDEMTLLLSLTEGERETVNSILVNTAESLGDSEIGHYELTETEGADIAAHVEAISPAEALACRAVFESSVEAAIGKDRAKLLLKKCEAAIIEQFGGFGQYNYDILVSRLDVLPGSELEQMFQINVFLHRLEGLPPLKGYEAPRLENVVSEIPERYRHIKEIWTHVNAE